MARSPRTIPGAAALLAAAAAAPALLCNACSAPGVTASAGYARHVLSGDVALSDSGGSLGSLEMDVEDSFGLGAWKGSPYGRVDANLGPLRTSLSAFQYKDSGSGTLERDFGGLTAGLDVESRVDIRNVKAAVHFDVVDLMVARLSPGVALDYFDIDMRVRAPAIGASEEVSAKAPVPMLFLQGEVDLAMASLTMDVGWMHGRFEDARGTWLDLEALVRVPLGSRGHLFAGYRHMRMDARGKTGDQDFSADIALNGWMLGGGLRF